MSQQVLGGGGLGFSQWQVTVVNEDADSLLGEAHATIRCDNDRSGDHIVLWFDGRELDRLIRLLREAQLKLADAGAT